MAGRFKQAFRVASMLGLAGVAVLAAPVDVSAAGEFTASLGGTLQSDERPIFITVGEPTRTPIGWVDFCIEYKPECATKISEPRDVVLTPKAWTDKEGQARPSLDMVASQVLSVYQVKRRRDTASGSDQPVRAAPPVPAPARRGDYRSTPPPGAETGADGWPASEEPWN